MILETFALAGQKFELRRAAESDVGPIVELLARDKFRAAVESSALEDRAPYAEAFRKIDADPAHLLCVVNDPAGAVVATMQLTFIPGLARAGATRLVQLTSDNSRTDAHRFHERLGFSLSHAGFNLQLA